MNAEVPTDPKAVKKMEKAMAKEAQADEKDYKRALKERKQADKSEAKATGAATKAEKHLQKMEAKEHDKIKSLQKATHKHDQALTDLHAAQSDVQIQKQQIQKTMRNVHDAQTRVEELFRNKQARDEERSRKLANLYSESLDSTQVA